MKIKDAPLALALAACGIQTAEELDDWLEAQAAQHKIKEFESKRKAG
jgi:hypothetical protein